MTQEHLYIKQERIKLGNKFVVYLSILGSVAILGITILDYYAVPELHRQFLIYRIATFILFIGGMGLYQVLMRLFDVFERSEIPVGLYFIYAALTVSTMVAYMVHDSGGHESAYYAGFLIVLIFTLGIVPLRMRVLIIMSVNNFLIYLVPILIYDEITNIPAFINNIGFLYICTFIGLLWFAITQWIYQGKLKAEYALIKDKENLENIVAERTRELVRAHKLESIGVFAGGLAHDLNNILSTIKSFAQMLIFKKDFPEDLKGDVNIIDSEIDKGSRLVDDLMNIGKDLKLSKSALNINKMLTELIGRLKQYMTGGVEIEQLFDEIPIIQADQTLIEQVLRNLMLNAKDSIGEEGRITISTSQIDRKSISSYVPSKDYDSFVCISVVDSGAGIPKENLQNVFDPFFTTKDRGQGTGMGLAMAHNIIDQHGGVIAVESTEGEGAVFSVYLPIN